MEHFSSFNILIQLFFYRNTKKTRDKVASLENDVTTAENHLEELQTELRNLEEEAKAVIQEQEIVHVLCNLLCNWFFMFFDLG